MSTNLYWRPKSITRHRLPIRAKYAYVKRRGEQPSVDWWEGVIDGEQFLDGETDELHTLVEYLREHGADSVEYFESE